MTLSSWVFSFVVCILFLFYAQKATSAHLAAAIALMAIHVVNNVTTIITIIISL